MIMQAPVFSLSPSDRKSRLGRYAVMFKAGILLMAAILLLAVWVTSLDFMPWQPIIQTICAVAISLAIFIVVLRATGRSNNSHSPRRRVRVTPPLALKPPVPIPGDSVYLSGRIQKRHAIAKNSPAKQGSEFQSAV